MNVLVMGAGAVGSVVGGLLAQAGHTVTLVGRPGHMAAIREGGLRLRGIWGRRRIGGMLTCSVAAHVPPLPCDVALLCVKAFDTRSALTEILPVLSPDTLVVSLQNGLGNLETVAELAGAERTAGGRVIFGADLVADGEVEVTVYGGPVLLGYPDGRAPDGRLTALAAALHQAGAPSEATGELLRHLWGKMLYNCSLNPLSALLDVPYGALLDQEPARQVMTQVIGEAFAAARAEGVVLGWDGPGDYRRTLFEQLIPQTAAHYASMRADLRRGRRTEIDALNGALARIGARHGIPTPTNALLAQLVRARELGLRPPPAALN